MHLTDEQLNEYLDHEISNRAQIELHLTSCQDCTARLTALLRLFDEVESLPELALSRDLASHVTRSLPVSGLPRWLTLTAFLQVAIAAITLIIGAPFVMQFVSPFVAAIRAPSFTEIVFQMQSEWITWLEMASQIQLPTLPEVPVVETSSLVIVLTLFGVSVFWLVGNGLLLRNRIK